MQELTQAQLKQQDFVDNTIYQAIVDLVANFKTCTDDLKYDGEVVGEIRDIIIDRYNLPDEFYPSVEE